MLKIPTSYTFNIVIYCENYIYPKYVPTKLQLQMKYPNDLIVIEFYMYLLQIIIYL